MPTRSSSHDPDDDGERLQKVLARIGLGSRRACEDLIADGRVRVNGEKAGLGRRVLVEVDLIEVDGTPIPVRPGVVHYLLNKPAGVVTTADDPQGRPTVTSLVPDDPRVFPVGRLDQDTEGLLILTNDGDLTHRLTHPRFGVEKEYLAHVEGTPSRGAVRRLREGIELEDGMTAPAQAALVADGLVRIVIHEGRNRQVRRMCEAIGHPVERLVRVRIGPLSDRKLKPGSWRELTTDEVMELERAASADGATESGAPKPPKRPNRPPAQRRAERDAAADARGAEVRAAIKARKVAASRGGRSGAGSAGKGGAGKAGAGKAGGGRGAGHDRSTGSGSGSRSGSGASRSGAGSSRSSSPSGSSRPGGSGAGKATNRSTRGG